MYYVLVLVWKRRFKLDLRKWPYLVPLSAGVTAVDGKRSLPKGAHVRFSHVETEGAAQAANAGTYVNTIHIKESYIINWLNAI